MHRENKLSAQMAFPLPLSLPSLNIKYLREQEHILYQRRLLSHQNLNLPRTNIRAEISVL